MPFGAARLCFLAKGAAVVVEAEVIRLKKGVVAIGNAQVDTAQSKFGSASALFDGTGDYAYALESYDFVNNDWTYEFWFRPSASVSKHTAGLSADTYLAGLSFYQSGTNMTVYSGGATGGWRYDTGAQSGLTIGGWSHIAVVKSGTNWKFFIDGVQKTSATPGGTMNPPSLITIGGVKNNGSWETGQGWIDELRVSNTARYTTGFTPSTTSFVNDENTLLLLHMDGTDASTVFEDDNGVRAKKGITAVGNAQIDTAQSKFGGTSYLGDGSGDYLTFSQSNDFTFGTNNFTVEMWVRLATTAGEYRPVFSLDGNGWPLVMFQMTNNVMEGYISLAGTSWTFANVNIGTFTTGNWYHICVVRNGSTFTWYLNGTQTQTRTSTGSIRSQRSAGRIGTSDTPYYWNGWVDEVRISNTARYTSNFTPSTTQFVNDENTLLLLHMDGTDASTVFLDDNGVRKRIGVSSVGGAQVDTAQSKFGGSSALFDGSNDYLLAKEVPYSAGDFTLEFWYYLPSTASNYYGFEISDASNNGISIQWLSTNQIRVRTYVSGTGTIVITSGTVLQQATWQHLALVRSSGTMTLYIDGASQGSTSYSTNMSGFNNTYIGATQIFASYLSGQIDEIRISDNARYTTGFTPSTTPFQNDTNTVLLLHMDGTDGSTVFVDDNGVPPDYEY